MIMQQSSILDKFIMNKLASEINHFQSTDVTNYQLPITNYQLPITNYQSMVNC